MVDIFSAKKIHLVGIKGVAMTSLAVILQQMGKRITGSDTKEIFPTQEILDKLKLKIFAGFDPVHIPKNVDLVIYTGAHSGKNNLEVQRALELKIPILSHGQALGQLMNQKKGISVAGSHGKTTTASMLAHVLVKSGFDPSYSVGCGKILSLGSPAAWGKGEYFVAEADEYVTDPLNDLTPRFQWQRPKILLITNIDFDHPDVYKDLIAVKKSFTNFITGNDRLEQLVINADDQNSEFVEYIKVPVIKFGQASTADFQITDIKNMGEGTLFNLKNVGVVRLSIPGKHNVFNAAAAAAVLRTLGLTKDQIIKHLATFTGSKRRLEKFGEIGSTVFIDDYAHHPQEIKASIAALKQWYPHKRLMVIFQPHTYSRTQALFKEFTKSFTQADLVVITDIYASAREKPFLGVSAQLLVKEMQKYQSAVCYCATREAVIKYLSKQNLNQTVVVLMGAGDIYNWQIDVLRLNDG